MPTDKPERLSAEQIAAKHFPPITTVAMMEPRSRVMYAVSVGGDYNEAARQECLNAINEALAQAVEETQSLRRELDEANDLLQQFTWVAKKLTQQVDAQAKTILELQDWKDRAEAAEQAIMRDDLDLAKALHIEYCEDLIEDGTPWEVPAEPEPQYFETLEDAIIFMVNLPERAASVPSVSPEPPRRIYAASRASLPERPAMWKRLRAEGVPIVSSWIDEAEPGASADIGELWTRIQCEISSSDRLVLYVESGDFPLKGSLVEVGMALGMGKQVWVVAPDVALDPRSMRPLGSWAKHPNVHFCANIHEAAPVSQLDTPITHANVSEHGDVIAQAVGQPDTPPRCPTCESDTKSAYLFPCSTYQCLGKEVYVSRAHPWHKRAEPAAPPPAQTEGE